MSYIETPCTSTGKMADIKQEDCIHLINDVSQLDSIENDKKINSSDSNTIDITTKVSRAYKNIDLIGMINDPNFFIMILLIVLVVLVCIEYRKSVVGGSHIREMLGGGIFANLR